MQIGRFQHLEQRVVRAGTPHAGSDRQKMQIMVAENCNAALFERHETAQRGERLRSAIHDVACEPEARIRVLRDFRVTQQFVER